MSVARKPPKSGDEITTQPAVYQLVSSAQRLDGSKNVGVVIQLNGEAYSWEPERFDKLKQFAEAILRTLARLGYSDEKR